jgi:Fic family protein
MPALIPDRLDAAEQAFIDQAIVKYTGHPGALLGILESVQERNPHKYLPLDALKYIAGKNRNTAVADLQRCHVLRTLQPATAGRQHYLYLSWNGMPYARISRPAPKRSAGTRPGA